MEKGAAMANATGHDYVEGRDYYDPPKASLFDLEELKMWNFYRACIAEFVAVMILLYITTATQVGAYAERRKSPCVGLGHLGISWAFGGTIFVLVYCTAGISGGHLNPAVTWSMVLARRVTVPRAIAYMAAQFSGAIVGCAIVKGMQPSLYAESGGNANAVAVSYSNGAGLSAEILGTFFLVYTVFSATDPKRNARDSHVPVLAPLPIGFVVFLVHLATIPTTGTGMNTAKSFATTLMYNHKKNWRDHWIFWVGPFVGATIATIYHKHILRAGAWKAFTSFRSHTGIF